MHLIPFFQFLSLFSVFSLIKLSCDRLQPCRDPEVDEGLIKKTDELSKIKNCYFPLLNINLSDLAWQSCAFVFVFFSLLLEWQAVRPEQLSPFIRPAETTWPTSLPKTAVR